MHQATLIFLFLVLFLFASDAFFRKQKLRVKAYQSQAKTFPSLRMLHRFETYLEKANSLNITLSDNEAASIAVAFYTQNVEQEFEKQLAVQELVKQLAVQGKEQEKQLAVQEKENAYRIRSIVALHRRELSALSQRVVLEGVSRDIVRAIPEDEVLQTALNATTVLAHTKKLMLAGNISVKMTPVSNALLNLPFRAAAWKAIGFAPDVPFPDLPGDTLYGDLSSSIHAPALKEVYLSDYHDRDSKVYLFFVAAAQRMEKILKIFSEEAAAYADTLGATEE